MTKPGPQNPKPPTPGSDDEPDRDMHIESDVPRKK